MVRRSCLRYRLRLLQSQKVLSLYLLVCLLALPLSVYTNGHLGAPLSINRSSRDTYTNNAEGTMAIPILPSRHVDFRNQVEWGKLLSRLVDRYMAHAERGTGMTSGAPWYTFPRIDNFGQIDPEGPYYKPDSNIQIPGGYPVTALLPGTVTAVAWTSWGQTVVTVALDSPLNSLATHTFYEHMSSATVRMGQHVSFGDLLGYNNPAGQVPLGFGLYSGDVYGSGSAWTTLQNDLKPGGAGLLNPVSLLDAFASGKGVGGYTGPVTLGASTTVTPPTGNPLGLPQGLTDWIGNPVRLFKLLGGILLIALGIILMIAPDTLDIAKGVAVAA